MKLTTKFVAATCIALPAFLTLVSAQEGLKITPLETIDFPLGYQTVMRLAEFAPGTCSGRHTHPGIAIDYMLEGETVLKVDGKPDQILKTGDPGQIPAGVPHEYCTTGGLKALTVLSLRRGSR